jgi:hypothetical protein
VIGSKAYAKDELSMKKLFLEAMQREHKRGADYTKTAIYQTPIRTDLKSGKSKGNVID